MDTDQERPQLRFERDRFVSGSTALTVTVLLGYAVIAPVASWARGTPGLQAAAAAAVICLAAGVMALAVAEWLSDRNPLAGLLGGMALRMVVPLVAVAAICWFNGPMATAGMAFYVLGFYMITLAAETYLAVRRV